MAERETALDQQRLQQRLRQLLDSPAVQIDDDGRAELLDGRLDLATAFAQGRLRTSDPAAVLAEQRAASVATPAAPDQMWPVGKRYDGGCLLVEADDIATFAQAIGEQGSWTYGPGAVAHPMFHARAMRDLLFAVMQDDALGHDFASLLHASHDARFLRLIQPGELLTMTGALRKVTRTRSGLRIVTRLQAHSAGEVVVDAHSVFFVPSGAPRHTRQPRPLPPNWPAPDHVIPLPIASDQSFRYARASRDDNPLHVDPQAARAAGQPDVIVHGLCTLALAGNAVVRAAGGGLRGRGDCADARQLRRLACRWTRPVSNGQTLTLRLWDNALGARFDIVDDQAGPVVRDGIAEFLLPLADRSILARKTL
ncbi:MAG: hypothetical protein GXP62_02280 [Oligoflexia bacterium]|nr:hypothetical protein [Oligoflexia bacterium]